uniref:Integrin, alpha 5 (fibronectin receptor, alpha polypeptide) n=1 Tax=Echeneis naucrates TaxID=173247 RepID=A0A665W2H2_ECHNA
MEDLWQERVCLSCFEPQRRCLVIMVPCLLYPHQCERLVRSSGASVVIGAPKADTAQVNVKQGGAVFYCPWGLSQSDCHTIQFDPEGNSPHSSPHPLPPLPFSPHQSSIFLHLLHNFTKFVEYAPCRTEISEAIGQGYCQGGFSADFTTDGKVVLGGPGSYFWQGQVISAAKEEIIKAYYPGYFMQSVEGQIQTKQVQAQHDDSYQGYSVAVGDFSGDQVEGKTTPVFKTLLSPMFMVRGSDGRLEEMGRVYVYLQRGPLNLELRLPHLTGTEAFGRFGSTIAPLGDLNQDGFNDVAVSCPFGGEDRQGLVYIYNGYSEGLREKPSQVIAGQWAAGTIPASFGFALRGDKDLDMNGYPDLIVGAFGVNKALLYRSRPIVNTTASLTIYPTMINPEEKNCIVTSGNASVPVSCVNLSFCISADGKHLPGILGEPIFHIFTLLQGEKDFRDKLSSIYVALNFTLDPKAAADSHGLRPILNYQTANVIEQKAQILLDCGEDNICVPDLKLAVHGDRKEVYLGDDNSLTLTFNAKNEGEGGAYEAELYVVLTQLTCSYETENQTRYLSCDLGNPMKSGTSLWAGLRFTVPRLKDTHKTVQFDLQIRSKNENNSHSEIVPYKLEVVVQADVILQGVSRPDKVFFPPVNWKLTKNHEVEQDVGPAVEHIYELVNNGPSRISHTLLELRCPLSFQGHPLLYPLEFSTEGPINCTSDKNMNHLRLKVSDLQLCADTHLPGSNESCSNVECWSLQCKVGLLERGTTAILKVLCSRPQVVTPVVWNKPDIENTVPLWIIILAILAGTLLLALLIYVLYKFDFFKRSVPYGTAMEKAQLKPQAASEA